MIPVPALGRITKTARVVLDSDTVDCYGGREGSGRDGCRWSSIGVRVTEMVFGVVFTLEMAIRFPLQFDEVWPSMPTDAGSSRWVF